MTLLNCVVVMNDVVRHALVRCRMYGLDLAGKLLMLLDLLVREAYRVVVIVVIRQDLLTLWLL